MKVILNTGSGKKEGHSVVSRIGQLLDSRQGELKVEPVHSGGELEAAANRARAESDSVIVAAGGDGTISAIASALIGTEKVLGILPLGTLNHFAKDLNIPLEIEQAADVIHKGHSIVVDVGQVNESYFLNNSSIGFYSAVVRNRDEQQKQMGCSKWLALFRAILLVFKQFPRLDVSLSVNGQTMKRRTPFIFVGNNPYQFENLEIGTRATLDSGNLCIFVAHATGPLAFIWLALRAVAGRLHAASDFDALCTTEVLIHSWRHRLTVAKDGEILKMQTPLRYRILPHSLRVIVPAPGDSTNAKL